MSDLLTKYAWENHNPYSLDIPKHPLYLHHEEANTLELLVKPTQAALQRQLLCAWSDMRAQGLTPLLFIHAESMQTEKTKNMQLFAWEMQQRGQRVCFLLPQNGIGDEHQRGENPETGFVISRAFPEKRDAALILNSNSLYRLKEQLAQRGITSANTDLICIDEVQLCLNQTHFEAVAGLLELQQAGFTVVINGIDYDFKSDPFTHMHHLLLMARFLVGWKTFQLTTLCRHCPNPAHGSRRVITFPDGRREIADASSPIVMPGLSDYYAVCDTFHKSCTRSQTSVEHIRLPLPTALTVAQIWQTPWMRDLLTAFDISPM